MRKDGSAAGGPELGEAKSPGQFVQEIAEELAKGGEPTAEQLQAVLRLWLAERGLTQALSSQLQAVPLQDHAWHWRDQAIPAGTLEGKALYVGDFIYDVASGLWCVVKNEKEAVRRGYTAYRHNGCWRLNVSEA